MTTVLECLQNARYNIENVTKLGLALLPLALNQFDNAIAFLEKGYPVSYEMDDLLDEYEDLTNLPEYDSKI